MNKYKMLSKLHYFMKEKDSMQLSPAFQPIN